MKINVFVFIALLWASTAVAQLTPTDHGGGEFIDIPLCHPDIDRPRILAEQDELMKQFRVQGKLNPASTDDPLLFVFPLRMREGLAYPGFHGVSGFVDHNPAFPNQRLDYMGGTRTYDLDSGYNHKGTDYFLWPFNWNMVDDDAVEVIAAAEGVISHKFDGNDHFNCSFGAGLSWNAVYLLHDDGSKTWYGHMKKHSLTTKGIGERVEMGEYLGVVASSGFSTGPHLHFEVYDSGNNLIDPYDGPSNNMTNRSWWYDQPEYYDSAINRIMTHSAPPQFLSCPQMHNINETMRYEPGNIMYFGAYYRDQRQNQVTQFRVFRPGAETPFLAWNGELTNVAHYSSSWWWWSRSLGAHEPVGTYTFDAFYQGVMITHKFGVGMDPVSIERDDDLPEKLMLFQNFPNPFNPTTMIRYVVGKEEGGSGKVRLTVFDLLGREVAVLVNGVQAPGEYTITFDAAGFSSGLYVYRLEVGGTVLTRKMTVLK